MKFNNFESMPLAIPLAQAPALCGLSRSTLYRLAAAGRIRLIKCGRTTLIDGETLRNCFAGLPTVVLRRRDTGSIQIWQRRPTNDQ